MWASARDAVFELYESDPEAARIMALGPNRQLRKDHEEEFADAAAIAHRSILASTGAFDSQMRLALLLTVASAAGFLLTAAALAAWITRLMYREHQGIMAEAQADAEAFSFERELADAMEMANADHDVYAIVEMALDQQVPDSPTELLITDSSEARLCVVSERPAASGPACPVATMWDCPAIQRAVPKSRLPARTSAPV